MDAGGRHVVVVEDEASLRDALRLALEREGYRVSTHADGLAAWEAFRQRLPDLVILDILMPRLDGLELCRRLRALSATLPIIFLTSKDEELDRVLGLELGGDDYLGKPFSLRELIARVRVMFRRAAAASAPAEPAELVEVGPLALDLARYTARWADAPLPLTLTEFGILLALARRDGHVKTRQQLLDQAYPNDAFVQERAVDTHIKRLRRKLAAAGAGADRIETVHGLGYRYRAG